MTAGGRLRIAAAITTYNRLRTLERCIAAVRAQTRPVDEIVVVDDLSSDGTAEWLAAQGDLVVVRHDENGGCAGSFHTAIRTAHARGHDLIWAMDDDVYPEPDTLGRLLAALEALEARGARVGALKTFERNWGTDRPVRLPFALPSTLGRALRDRYMSREVVAQAGAAEPVEIRSFNFCGTLFPRAALDAAGFPAADYYYYGEDYDLAFRLGRQGFRLFLVPDALVEHEGGGFNAPRLLPPRANWRYYYMYRNQWRLMRDHGGLMRWDKRAACRLRILLGAASRLWHEGRRGNLGACRLTLKGLADGVLGRKGKRVAPSG